MARLQDLFAWDAKALTIADREITTVTDRFAYVVPGCLFVCIQGKRFDGHSVAEQALERGAAAVVVQKDVGVKQQIRVKDSRRAYAYIAAAFHAYPARELTLIGVTGTNGKTTSCFLLKEILEQQGYRTGLLGTVKTVIAGAERRAQLTTPDPLELQRLLREMVDTGCTHCVMEVSSQALDQKRVAGVIFDAALFTNLTQDHLDYHGSFEAYQKAKQQLFAQAKLSVVNLDDPAAADMLLASAGRTASFSAELDQADYTAHNCKTGAQGVEYELVGNGIIGRIKFPVPGGFSVLNSLGAAVTALELGVPLEQIQQAIAKTTVPGRLERVQADTDYTVLIDYAHTPDALENVLKTLREIAPARVICLFGCGGDRDAGKRPLMGEIAARCADIAVVTSDNPRSENPDLIIADICKGIPLGTKHVHVEKDRKRAIAYALRKAKPQDIVLLAGKGQETYQILGDKTIDFDERVIVTELLAKGLDV